MGSAFKVDVLDEGRIVLKLQSVECLMTVHGKQMLAYLKLMNLPLGVLMNFGQPLVKSALRRIVNDYAGMLTTR